MLVVACVGFLFSSGASRGEQAEALAILESKAKSPRIKKDPSGKIIEIAVNAPDFSNEDLALFNEFDALEKLTISHAGYANAKRSGVDYSGVALLKDHQDHQTLRYFSAGGAIGSEYLAALPALTKVTELYIQTTHSVDDDWKPIGKMTQLTYLGIRVRNDRMSELTDAFFQHLQGLENLERFLLSEMTFADGEATHFVAFVRSLPRLEKLEIRRCDLPDGVLEELKRLRPGLEIEVTDR